MTAGGTAELRRPLNRAEHQATMARLARSPRTWNRAIHRAIVARFGEAGCLMTAACNESTVENAVLAWSMELAHSHPGSRDNSRDRVSQAPERASVLSCHLSCQHGRKGILANPLTERPVVSNALIFREILI